MFNICDYIIFSLLIVYLLRYNLSSWNQWLSPLFIYNQSQAKVSHFKNTAFNGWICKLNFTLTFNLSNTLLLSIASFLEKEMMTHPIILAWKISWTKGPGRVQYTASQRVRHNWVTDHACRASFHPEVIILKCASNQKILQILLNIRHTLITDNNSPACFPIFQCDTLSCMLY